MTKKNKFTLYYFNFVLLIYMINGQLSIIYPSLLSKLDPLLICRKDYTLFSM